MVVGRHEAILTCTTFLSQCQKETKNSAFVSWLEKAYLPCHLVEALIGTHRRRMVMTGNDCLSWELTFKTTEVTIPLRPHSLPYPFPLPSSIQHLSYHRFVDNLAPRRGTASANLFWSGQNANQSCQSKSPPMVHGSCGQLFCQHRRNNKELNNVGLICTNNYPDFQNKVTWLSINYTG